MRHSCINAWWGAGECCREQGLAQRPRSINVGSDYINIGHNDKLDLN